MKHLILSFLILCSLVLGIPSLHSEVPLTVKSKSPAPPSEFVVEAIIDVNILKSAAGPSIRMLGVEATRNIEAKRKGMEYLETNIKGKTFTLEYDKKTKDPMGRFLAYVYFEDGNMLNEEVLWRGYGYASKKYPCKYIYKFRRYENDAKRKNHGLWKKLTKPGETKDK